MGGEVDGFASKDGRNYAIEAKNTKQKIGVEVIKNLEKKIAKTRRTMKGAIIVSRSGFTEEALKEETKDILLFKYKPRKRKSDSGWTL
jgi:HJR/Mrr/RecB family endonuclease